MSDAGGEPELEPFTDTALYALGAYFADRHPELMDDVVRQAQRIEDTGVAALRRQAGRDARIGAADAHHGPRRALLPGGRGLRLTGGARPAAVAGRGRVHNARRIGAWRSLVARSVRVGEVPGSNPGAPMWQEHDRRPTGCANHSTVSLPCIPSS